MFEKDYTVLIYGYSGSGKSYSLRNIDVSKTAYINVEGKPLLIKNAFNIFKQEMIYERHRHRYEFNNLYKNDFSKHDIKFSGLNQDLNLVEIVELPNHPWFIGVQFHPEFKSRPNRAHPLFREFIKAAIKNSR